MSRPGNGINWILLLLILYGCVVPIGAYDSKIYNTALLGDPINASTGAYMLQLPLFDLGGQPPLKYSLSYRSIYSDPPTYGGNLVHNVPAVVSGYGTATVQSFNDDGSRLVFQNAQGSWTISGNSRTVYRLIETENYYYLMDPDDALVYIFIKRESPYNPAFSLGHLLFKIDRNGNRLSYTHDAEYQKLTRIEDGRGRSLDFDHSVYNKVTITDQGGRTVTYTQVSNQLRTITDPMGQVTSFHYDPDLDRRNSIIHSVLPEGNTRFTQIYETVFFESNRHGRVKSQIDAH